MAERVGRDVISDEYDIHERTGFPPSVVVPSMVAGSCLVDDAAAEGKRLHLVERLVRLDAEGFMGRPCRVAGLREMFKQVSASGFLWDEATGHFMEDPRSRRTPNWGRLIEGEEHRFSLLRIDVVRNSRIVRVRGEAAARDAFDDLRAILARVVEPRNGRVWSWEGDGALAAYLFGHSTTSAVLSGMALLHELFLYNRLDNKLGEPVVIRAAVHTGPLRYHPDLSEMTKQETVLEVMEAESKWTPAGCLSISPAVAPTLDRVIADRFRSDRNGTARVLTYDLRFGTP